jgi:hypothetical protein
MKTPRPLVLLVAFVALLCAPAAASAFGPANTHVDHRIGELDLQIHANARGYQLESLHARLRSCYPHGTSTSTAPCKWRLIGGRSHHGLCARGITQQGLEESSNRMLSAEADRTMSLSVPGTHQLELRPGVSAGEPVCWYVIILIPGRVTSHYLAETRFD